MLLDMKLKIYVVTKNSKKVKINLKNIVTYSYSFFFKKNIALKEHKIV